MSALFKTSLPLPPSVNESLVPVRMPRGSLRMVHTPQARRWANNARLLLLTQRRPPALRSGPVAIRVEVHVPTIASDGGNRLKLLEDALVAAGVIADDRQIAEWTILKVVGRGAPRVEVEVSPADPAAHPELSERLAKAEGKRTTKGGRS